MRVAFFASEMIPYIKTGGLADVIGSLPRALIHNVDQIDVFIPYYREIERQKLPLSTNSFEFKIKIGSRSYKGTTFELKTDYQNLRVFFVDNYHFFRRRSELYVKDGRDYHDNLARFIFFCRGALKTTEYLSSMKPYDVFHMHDWQTALVGIYTELSRFHQKNPPTRIFTIHNLAYQGKFPRSQFRLLNLDSSYYHFLEFWGKLSMMKAGIIFSDLITTVSPTYAQEIQTKRFGAGLEELIKQNKSKLYGILNGVDYSIWNPENDPYIPSTYSINDLSGKLQCKNELQQRYSLTENPEIPILGVVSRLAWQKGMELVLKVISQLLGENRVQFVLLGTGDHNLEQKFHELGNLFPSQTGISLTYNDSLAHQIEAGADIFLMPSRYEPCGLNDKYSLRYGTIPIAFKTGGLSDSIIDYSSNSNKGTGFLFSSYDEGDFRDAIERALKVFQSKQKWVELVQRAMRQDFSWENAAKKYLNLYQKQKR
ncbi:MAG: glycogen synthase GlgA [Candidatus Heimdallarchaeota archaeon]|nr:MAG: glycogen synthase GlgA [Candidatus Heimdallarchaeota archaeon]